MPEMLTLTAAAEELGVHYMTVYRYVRLGILPARKQGASWLVGADDVAAMKNPESAHQPARKRKADWAGRLHSRLLAADEAGAWGVLEAALASGMEPAGAYLEVIGPAMRAIGDGWAERCLDVADEHRATAVATRLVSRLGPMFVRRGRGRGLVIAGTPPGDPHALASAMIADLLRGSGFEVIDLGGDVPTQSLVRMLRTVTEAAKVVTVVISVSYIDSEPDLGGHVAAVRAACDVPVLVGGSAVRDEEHALGLGATGWAEDAPGAIALTEACLAGR